MLKMLQADDLYAFVAIYLIAISGVSHLQRSV